MTTPRIVREVSGAIMSIGRNPGNTTHMITMPPEGGSKYPLNIYTKDDAMIEGLKPGMAVTLVLERGALKQGKEGKYNSDYFENLLEVRQGAPTPKPTPAPSSQPQGGGYRDERGVSIERQVCFKAAVDLVAAAMRLDSPEISDLDTAANYVEILTNRFAASVFHHALSPAGDGPEINDTPASDGSDAPPATLEQLRALTAACGAKKIDIKAKLNPYVAATYGVETPRQLTGPQCDALTKTINIMGAAAVALRGDADADGMPF